MACCQHWVSARTRSRLYIGTTPALTRLLRVVQPPPAASTQDSSRKRSTSGVQASYQFSGHCRHAGVRMPHAAR
jgi:hypothetical protein